MHINKSIHERPNLPNPSKCCPMHVQNSQTYQNRKITAAKKANQTFQPTPVRSAMRSMRFIVPRRRTRVLSNESFIFSASAVESRISSPMANVICVEPGRQHSAHVQRTHARMCCFSLAVRTYIFQHLDLGAHAIQLLVILAFQLAQHRIAVLAARIGRCAPVTALTRRGVGCARIGRKGGARISGARESVAGARSWSARGA